MRAAIMRDVTIMNGSLACDPRSALGKMPSNLRRVPIFITYNFPVYIPVRLFPDYAGYHGNSLITVHLGCHYTVVWLLLLYVMAHKYPPGSHFEFVAADYYDREQMLWQLLWDGTLLWLPRRLGDHYATVSMIIIVQRRLVIIPEQHHVIMVIIIG